MENAERQKIADEFISAIEREIRKNHFSPKYDDEYTKGLRAGLYDALSILKKIKVR